jgi:glycosyltransferase involved in cell wall biosynthesis
MTRLLMTADAVGGVWTYALEMARVLAARRIATTLAVMGPAPSADQLAAAADVPGLDLRVGAFRLEWMPDAQDDVVAAGDWLLDVAAEVRPTLVHINGYAHAALPFDCPVVAAGHSCVLSWREAAGGDFDEGWLEWYQTMAAAGLQSADWVIAPSAAMLDALQRHYGPLERTSVVPNGVRPERFQPGAREPLVLAAGRLWDRAKNVDAVLDVAPQVSWRVRVAGDGGQGEHWLGRLPQDELATWLGRASIFAAPARYEPFGLLPLEAALAGCALVLGDIPSLREVWGDAALFVPPEDRDALTGAIQALIEWPVLRAGMAARARERALTYSADRMADRYLWVTTEMCGCAL